MNIWLVHCYNLEKYEGKNNRAAPLVKNEYVKCPSSVSKLENKIWAIPCWPTAMLSNKTDQLGFFGVVSAFLWRVMILVRRDIKSVRTQSWEVSC